MKARLKWVDGVCFMGETGSGHAVVMDGAVIGESSIVAAMSFVKTGMIVPPKSLVMGMPAKVARTLSDEEIAWKHRGTVEYQQLAVRCMQEMKEVEALTAVEPNRQRLRPLRLRGMRRGLFRIRLSLLLFRSWAADELSVKQIRH